MDAFDCHGRLQIAILSPSNPIAFVKLMHRDDHIPYWNIDIPKDVRDFVLKNLSLTPQQVKCLGCLLKFKLEHLIMLLSYGMRYFGCIPNQNFHERRYITSGQNM